MGDASGYKAVENMELEPESGANNGGGGTNMKKIAAIAGIATAVLLLVVGVILYVTGFPYTGGAANCADDGYAGAVTTDGVYLKYRAFDIDADNFETYDRAGAVDKCASEEGAELWEPRNVAEFKAVFPGVKGKIWLSAKPAKECKDDCGVDEDAAAEGRGVRLTWDSGSGSAFSMLANGRTTLNRTCVTVDPTEELPWELAACSASADAMCVKRGCSRPPPPEAMTTASEKK